VTRSNVGLATVQEKSLPLDNPALLRLTEPRSNQNSRFICAVKT